MSATKLPLDKIPSVIIDDQEYNFETLKSLKDEDLSVLFRKYCSQNGIFSVDGSSGLTLREAFATAIKAVHSNGVFDQLRCQSGTFSRRATQAEMAHH